MVSFSSEYPPEAYGSASLALRLADLDQQHLHVGLDSRIVYPGSSGDVTVAEVFGHERVTHIDYDERLMRLMAKMGFLTFVGSSADFSRDFSKQVPKENRFDMMVALTAPVLTDLELEKLLKPGGFVVTNELGSANVLEQYGLLERIETSGDETTITGRHFYGGPVLLYRSTE